MSVSKLAGYGFMKHCRKVVAVGRNYAEHAKELGNAVPTKPVLFLKPPSSFIPEGKKVEVPPGCKELHHEVELGIVIGKGGRDIPKASAVQHIAGYFLALDMTARNLQNEAKKGGLPWAVSKGYDTFLPASKFISKDKVSNPDDIDLWLKVDDKLRQKGSTKDMLFNVPSLISYISTIFTLEEGDCILTGTPEGVGPVTPGQTISCGLGTVAQMNFGVEKRLESKL